MDGPGHAPAVLLDNLGDLRRVNRGVGGVRLSVRGLDRLTVNLPHGAALTVLDLATGGADIPRALVGWARRRRLRARVVATDVSPEIIALASARPPTPHLLPHLRFAVADARCLPFADRSVDVVHCSLALHHQLPDDGVAMQITSSRRASTAEASSSPVVACAAPGTRRTSASACAGRRSALEGMQA